MPASTNAEVAIEVSHLSKRVADAAGELTILKDVNFTVQAGGTLAIVLGVIAVTLILTSFVGTCPGYLPFGLSTRKGPGGPSSAG